MSLMLDDYAPDLFDRLFEIWENKYCFIVLCLNVCCALIYVIWTLFVGNPKNEVYVRAFLWFFVSIIAICLKVYGMIYEKFYEHEYKNREIQRIANEFKHKYEYLKRLVSLLGHISPENIVIASTKEIETYDGPPAARMYANGRIVADDNFDGFPSSQEQIRYYFRGNGDYEVLWLYWCLYCDFLRLKTKV